MPVLPVRAAVALVVILIGLVGCAGLPRYAPDGARTLSERSLIRALRAAEASDAQRLEVLAAFDRVQPRLAQAAREAEAQQLAYAALSPRATGYLAQVDALAERRGRMEAERLRATAEFEHAVAQILDERQWEEWQHALREQARLAAFEAPPSRVPRAPY